MPRPISPRSNTSQPIFCDCRQAKTRCAQGEKSPPGTMSSLQAFSPHNAFTRFPCLVAVPLATLPGKTRTDYPVACGLRNSPRVLAANADRQRRQRSTGGEMIPHRRHIADRGCDRRLLPQINLSGSIDLSGPFEALGSSSSFVSSVGPFRSWSFPNRLVDLSSSDPDSPRQAAIESAR
jgi:hypothetical protein